MRVEDRVITLALMIAHGVNGNGSREILAVEPMFDESEDWPTDRSYIKREKIQEAMERNRAFLAAQAAS